MSADSIVLFAEDPGAANCIAPVAEALAQSGTPTVLWASGHALATLRGRGLAVQELTRAAQAIGAWAVAPPRWLLVGTSENLDSPAFELTAAARARGIATAAIIDAAANAAHRFRGRDQFALRHAPEWLLVPDAVTADEFVRLGHAPARVIEVGHPHFDYLRAARARLESLGRDALRARCVPQAGARFVLVFVSEISTGLDPQQYRRSRDYTLHGRGDAEGRTGIVVEELVDAVAHLAGSGVARPWMVLRRHPKEAPEALAALAGAFDQQSAGGEPLELLYAADLVVGMTTMALAEAHLSGVPTLSVLPRDAERDWLPMIRSGAIDSAVDREELRRKLRERLQAPPARGQAPRVAVRSSTRRILDFLGVLP